MDTTPPSLLVRLQRTDAAAWDRFIFLYSPLFFEWVRRLRVPEQDAQDIVQNALVRILSSIGNFRRVHAGGFRGWLFTIVQNCVREMARARARRPMSATPIEPDEVPTDDPLIQWTDEEHRVYLLRRITELVRVDFPAETWTAFRLYVLEGKPAAEVAAELGLTPNAVYLARGRVLRRIREELAGMLD